MAGRTFLRPNIDLTTALRPAYLPDEVLLFVQDNVGLYEGKYKLAEFQNGQVYLTSHRICYVDNENPRSRSVAIDLKDVERYQYYARFLKSSPKISLVPKPSKRSSLQNRPLLDFNGSSGNTNSSPLSRSSSLVHRPNAVSTPPSVTTWICTICSFSNPVPSNFDWQTANERTLLPPCLMCGIKPAYSVVFKAAITNAKSHATSASPSPLKVPTPLNARPDVAVPQSDYSQEMATDRNPDLNTASSISRASFQCPKCTFLNHPSLLSCELCGAPLTSQDVPRSLDDTTVRSDSPGPVLNSSAFPALEEAQTVKLSFRGGGEKIFFERLKGSIQQRKWKLDDAPPVPTPNRTTTSSELSRPSADRVRTGGIAGLEQRRRNERENNELVIGNAFEDLAALMASAKDIIALAESFNGSTGTNDASSSTVATALGLVTTKDMLGGGSNSASLYISELSRNVAEFLTDDARGVLRKAGGIISLVDLWAMFNRARGGVELVSPMDFEKAAKMWETLRLPVRLRQFKSGVLVVQGSDRTDEKTIKTLLSWLADLHVFPPDRDPSWNWHLFGRGVTAQDTAERFGWSIGIAEEELEMAEEKGALCREDGIEGTKFWENWLDETHTASLDSTYNVT